MGVAPLLFKTNGIHMLRIYAELMRLNKPIGIWLLLWPTLWALWFATVGHPPLSLIAIFITGVILMRSAGCVINDVTDREFDPHVARTRNRPLARNACSPAQANGLFIALISLAGILAFSCLNLRAIFWALPALALTVVYPYCKRYTQWPQLILGMAFASSIPMVYAQCTGAFPTEAALLYVATVLWTFSFDTWYAMTDQADDFEIGILSSARALHRHSPIVIGACLVSALSILAYLGYQHTLKWPFYAGLLAAALCIGQQYRLTLILKPAQPLSAFRNNAWLGAWVFLGIVLGF